MDLKPRMDLGGQNLLHGLSPEDHYLPYWYMVVEEDLSAEYRFRPYCTGHNIGRWWNVMLRLEDCTGFEIPGAVEEAMLENSWKFCDNPTGIFLEDVDLADASRWYLHSYRETMLSFGLLAKYRASERARERGVRAIEQMRRASQDLGLWDFSFGGGNENLQVEARHAYTHGRVIEGLLCFYEATGEALALEEAERLADFHFQHLLNADGSLADGCGHHTHSYLNTVRGLLALAGMNKRADQLEAIYATYKDAMARMMTRSGFVPHDIGSKFGGDIASAGDIAHIALMLWDHFADPRLLDDAERIVRARLLPAQVLEPMPVKPGGDEGLDCYRDLPRRFVGAIGGAVGHVKGQSCVTDFTAAALHSLIEIANRIVDIGTDYVRVNFHLDWDGPSTSVHSVRCGTAARLTVRDATDKDLLVRIPGWAREPSLLVDGEATEISARDGFASISGTGGQRQVELHYSLPECDIEEEWRDEFATRERATFKWRGDEIYAVEPIGRYLEPFPT